MTLEVKIKFDKKKLQKSLNKTRREIPRAIKYSLDDVAKNAQQHARDALPKYLDRPTPYTVKGIQHTLSKITNPFSTVYIEQNRWKYLQYQVKGGTVSPPGGVALPVKIKLNKYGNIAGRRTGILNKNPNRYIARRKDFVGIWQRYKKRPPKLLAVIEKTVTYKPRLPFIKIVKSYTNKHHKPTVNRYIKQALNSLK